MDTLDILPHFLAAGALIALGGFAWRSRRLPAVFYLILTLFLSAIWVTSEAFALLSAGPLAKLFWLKVTFVSLALLPVTWLAVVIMFTGQLRKLVRRYLLPLFFIPVITTLIIWTGEIGTPGFHGELLIANVRQVHISGDLFHLLRQAPITPTTAASPMVLVLAYTPRPWFWVQSVYSTFLQLFSYFLLGRALLSIVRSLRNKSRPEAGKDDGIEEPAHSEDWREEGTIIGSIKRRLGGTTLIPSRGNVRTLSLLLASSLPPIVVFMFEMSFQINLSMQMAQMAGQPFSLGRITLYSRSLASPMLLISAALLAFMFLRNRTLSSESIRIIPVARSALVESMRDGVLVLDRQNRILDFNPAAQYIVSAPARKEDTGRLPTVLRRGLEVSVALAEFPDLLDALGQRDLTKAVEAKGAAADSASIVNLGDSQTNTVRLTRRGSFLSNGEESSRYMDMRVSAIFEKNGEVSGRVVVLRDITERKRAEDDLRHLKDFNEAIVQNISEGLAVEDAQGNFTFVNPAGAGMLGYKPEEMVGMQSRDLAAKDQIPLVEHANTRRKQGQSDRYELNLIRKDGSTITVLVAGTPLFDGLTRQFAGTVDVYVDITERKLAELAISSSDRRHRRLVEQLAVLNRIGLAVFAPGETSPGDSSPRDINSVIHVLYQQCQQIGEMDCFFVALYNESTEMLRFPVFYNRNDDGEMQVTSYDDSRLEDYTGLTGYVIRSYRTLYIADLTDSSQLPVLNGRRVMPLPTSTLVERSFLAVPLVLGAEPAMLDELAPNTLRPELLYQPPQDLISPFTPPPFSRPAGASHPSVVGVISMQSYQPNMYTEEQIKLLETVAVQAAIALENSRLYEQLQHELEQRRQAEEALLNANVNMQNHVEEIDSLQANLHATLARLAEQAIRDPLTNLFNRRYLHETLERELARASRQGLPVSLVMADIDNFKPLNDTFLHDAGDRVLQALSDLLRTQSRQEDIACRYGGEEFVVVMPGAPLDVALQRAERWRQSFSELEFRASEEVETDLSSKVLHGKLPGTFRVTISLGVATFPEHGVSGDSLLRAADRALYNAKEAGRNQTHVYKNHSKA